MVSAAKLVDSGCVEEKRFANLAIDDSITVKEALVAFYTLLTNYDYKVDLGLNSGLDPVAYMQQIGVYTGQKRRAGFEGSLFDGTGDGVCDRE